MTDDRGASQSDEEDIAQYMAQNMPAVSATVTTAPLPSAPLSSSLSPTKIPLPTNSHIISPHTTTPPQVKHPSPFSIHNNRMTVLCAAAASASSTPRTTTAPLSPSSSLPLTPMTPKKKGARVFTKEEKDVLAAAYAKECFPLRRDLEELARRFNKPVRKVKTWFNNRRSLDRKFGKELVRPTKADRVSVLSIEETRSEGGGKEVGATGQEGQGEAGQNTQTTTQTTPARHASRESLYVTPAAASMARHQSFRATPVTNVRPSPGMATPSPPALSSSTKPPKLSTSGRVKLSPARFRRIALEIKDRRLEGEDYKVRDNGLELKFLYGKRKISYEWYVGKEKTDPKVTGGPYAKMEINFDSIWRLSFVRGTSGCLVEVHMSDAPQMLLQTEVNISQFQNRTQQRQYRRVKREEGRKVTNVDVTAPMHKIFMRADDAARVRKTLMDHVPELRNVTQLSYQTPPMSPPSAYWASPMTSIMSTPVLSNGVTRPQPSNCLVSRGPHSVRNMHGDNEPSQTPKAERLLPSTAKGVDGSPVRRELDFGTNQCTTPGASVGPGRLTSRIEPITGKKRGLPQPTTNENDPNEINRQRLRFTSAPMLTPSLAVPPPPLPPPIPGMHQLGLTVDPRLAPHHWRQPQLSTKPPLASPNKEIVNDNDR